MIQPQTVSLGMPVRGNGGPHLVISAHGGRILKAHQESALLTGYTVEELETLRLGDLLGRQDYTEVMAFLEHSLLSGGGELGGIHIYRKDDSPRSVILTVQVLGDEETMTSQYPGWPSALLCFLEDVTERERISRQMQQEKRAILSLPTLPDTLVAESPSVTQELEHALDQILQILASEIGGIYIAESPDNEGPLALKAVQGTRIDLDGPHAALSADDPLLQRLVAEGQRHGRNGHQTPILVRERTSASSSLLPLPWAQAGVRAFMARLLGTAQKPIGLLLIGADEPRRFSSRDRDLLELSSHQLSMAVENGLLLKDLLQMKQFSATVLRDMSDGLFTVDAQGRITTLNQAAERILGCSASDVEGWPLTELLGQDSHMVALVYQAMAEGSSHVRSEVVVRRGDGRPVPVGASVAILRSGLGNSQVTSTEGDGEVKGAAVVFTDLTQQKNAEEKRRHQDRLALLGEWSAVLAHEVRNPLAGIVHGIQYVAEELNPDGDAAQSVRFILEESHRIRRLLDETLNFLRPQDWKFVTCDLQSILEGLLDYWLSQAAARAVEVSTSYAEDLSAPMGDPDRLRQVFANLISNALDAMPDGGTLWLRVRPAQLPPVLAGQMPRPAVRVEVEDTGVGIPDHVMRRIYDRFFTTKERGTGLGLAISQRIVQDHRGKIDVHSEVGKGTLFTVFLPLEATEVSEPQPYSMDS